MNKLLSLLLALSLAVETEGGEGPTAGYTESGTPAGTEIPVESEAPAETVEPTAPVEPALPEPVPTAPLPVVPPVVEPAALSDEDRALLEALLERVEAADFSVLLESGASAVSLFALDQGEAMDQVAAMKQDLTEQIRYLLEHGGTADEVAELAAEVDQTLALLKDVEVTAEQVTEAMTTGINHLNARSGHKLPDDFVETLTRLFTDAVQGMEPAERAALNEELKDNMPAATQGTPDHPDSEKNKDMKFVKAVNDVVASAANYTYTTEAEEGFIGTGMWITSGDQTYYTYCSQEHDYQYPGDGIPYVATSNSVFDGETAAKLARALEAGYPLDQYGLGEAGYAEGLSNGNMAYYTQAVIWSILSGEKNELINYSVYGNNLFEYAVNAVSLTRKDEAAVTITSDSLKDGKRNMTAADGDEKEYTVSFQLTPNKTIQDMTVTDIPENCTLTAVQDKKTTELEKGDTFRPTADLTLSCKEGVEPAGELKFSYVSYQTVDQGSIHAFSSYTLDYNMGTAVVNTPYQRMIGFALKDVTAAVSTTVLLLEEEPDPEQPTPTPTPSPVVPDGGGDDDDRPERPVPSPVPSAPPEEPEVVVPEDPAPLAPAPVAEEEETVEIGEEPLPLAPAPETASLDEELVILDETVPLGALPQTGTTAPAERDVNPAAVLLALSALCGAACLGLARRRENAE